MKKLLCIVVSLLLIVSFATIVLAKQDSNGKGNGNGNGKNGSDTNSSASQSESGSGSTSNSSAIEIDFLCKSFGMDTAKITYFTKYNFTSEELGLVLYFYSVSGRPINSGEVDYIVKNKGNWAQLSWYFGVPPIMLEDGILKFRHPARVKNYPPMGKSEFKHEGKGEKVDFKKDKYEYEYTDKSLGIEEKLEIKKDKYSYRYSDKYCEEKLEVKYPSYRYEYHYKDKKTGKEIKKSGTGRPIDPTFFYKTLKQERQTQPGFQFNININIKF